MRELMVTTAHVAGVPVRNANAADFGKHYGTTILTCVPADPATKGGVEAAVKLAKADLVPTGANLRAEYACFEDVETACSAFTEAINAKTHAVTKQAPAQRFEREKALLHPVPQHPAAGVIGVERVVPENTPMVSFENGQYSVPARLLGRTVRVRATGPSVDAQVVISANLGGVWVEVTRHPRATPGSPSIHDAHFPGHDPGKTPGDYPVKPSSAKEEEFCRIGEGAKTWLREAASNGAERIRTTMHHAITLARTQDPDLIDRTLGLAATYKRFAPGDLTSIAQALSVTPEHTYTAAETSSLAQGTTSWAGHTTT